LVESSELRYLEAAAGQGVDERSVRTYSICTGRDPEGTHPSVLGHLGAAPARTRQRENAAPAAPLLGCGRHQRSGGRWDDTTEQQDGDGGTEGPEEGVHWRLVEVVLMALARGAWCCWFWCCVGKCLRGPQQVPLQLHHGVNTPPTIPSIPASRAVLGGHLCQSRHDRLDPNRRIGRA
jgi:hypothetical protein